MIEFLTLKSKAFGLDVSDLSLKIAYLEKTRKGFGLSSWGEKKIEPGIIEVGKIKDEESFSNHLRESVKGVKGKKIDTKNVVVSLPEEKSFLQVIQTPKMSKEELNEAIYQEVENYVPLPIENVYFDFEIIEPVKNHLDHFDVLINAIPKEIVNPYVASFKKANLQPVVLEFESRAIVRSLIKNNVSGYPIMIIDIGKRRTSFIIFSGHSLRFTFSSPVSSGKITEFISQKRSVDFSQAEKIKKELNLKKQDKESKEIFEIIKPVLSDLTDQVKKYINFYSSHASHEHLSPSGESGKIKKIIFCGGGASLEGLDYFLEEKTGIPTRKGNPLMDIKNSSEFPSEKSLSFTTALGLALRKS